MIESLLYFQRCKLHSRPLVNW